MALRKIIHIDMDAFFASIEQRDNPQLRGKPVIIAGDPSKRGVVSTCSYEARRFGVHSAMPTYRAKQLCPNGIFLPSRMDHYRRVSREMLQILQEVTDRVEPFSIDEAYLDVTENKINCSSATIIAKELQRTISRRLGLTASAGVSYNLFLAKIASGLKKPAGLTVIRPEEAATFLDRLPIEKFYGIGKVTAKKFADLQIFRGADLKKLSLSELSSRFGKIGKNYYYLVRGEDPRVVTPQRKRKSIGREVTLLSDSDDFGQLERILDQLIADVLRTMAEERVLGHTVTLIIRLDTFQRITRSFTKAAPFFDPSEIYRTAKNLLQQRINFPNHRLRLIGISIGKLIEKERALSSLMVQGEFNFG